MLNSSYNYGKDCNKSMWNCDNCNKTISPLFININASATVVIASLCIVGNGAFIILFAFNKNIRNLNSHAVVCLAFGDVLRGTIVMIPKMVTEFGEMSNIIQWFGYITAFASAFTFVFNPMILALIAFIRYIIIVPWTKRAQWLTFAKLHLIICLIFLGAVLFSCLPFMSKAIGTYEFSIYHGVYFTSWDPKENKIFRIIFYVCVIGIAFPVLILSYIKIGLALRDHNRRMKAVMPKSMSDPIVDGSRESVKNYGTIRSTPTTLEQLEQSSKTSKRKLFNRYFPCLRRNKCQTASNTKTKSSVTQHVNTNLTKQEYQTTKMMFLICIAYIVCWFPAAVVNIMALGDDCKVSGVSKMAIVTIIEVKTCLNPMFYGLGNKQYRKMFIDFFKKQCRCRRR